MSYIADQLEALIPQVRRTAPPGHGGSAGKYATRVIQSAVDALRSPRDDFHTMEELYEYRMLYNALAANSWDYPVVKSWHHSDGELCFGGGWFIVVMTLPTGQVSNHYKAEHWDLFQVPATETPPPYDGHTPAEAARRMRAHLENNS